MKHAEGNPPHKSTPACGCLFTRTLSIRVRKLLSDDADCAVKLQLNDMTISCMHAAAESARLDAMRGCAQRSMSL